MLTLNSDKKLLWNNRNVWCGHSQWLIAMLKAVDWNDPVAADQGMFIVSLPFSFDTFILALHILKNPHRRYTCYKTMCSRSCEVELLPSDALWLLSEVCAFTLSSHSLTSFPVNTYFCKGYVEFGAAVIRGIKTEKNKWNGGIVLYNKLRIILITL